MKRKYKVNLNKPKKFLPGEHEHIGTMVVVLKIAGYSNTQIAKVIGLSRGQVKEFLADPKIAEQVVALREALPAAALDLLQGYLIEAVQAVVDVMRRTPDDKLVLAAAAEIFDRAGLPKASRQERLNEDNKKITFTDDGIVEALREASPEVQEKAAQMIEEFEKMLAEATNQMTDELEDA